ncbi:unnamed protein product [Cylicocyclus nassatus]|uniref:Uncharacterized protein n=1 Tax=Cylicocyclus nassatus TaxID=53992 RepID=A0AA36H9E2_CYLNA|nr:unnamed protein product [Cylicocyclus nassatus]
MLTTTIKKVIKKKSNDECQCIVLGAPAPILGTPIGRRKQRILTVAPSEQVGIYEKRWVTDTTNLFKSPTIRYITTTNNSLSWRLMKSDWLKSASRILGLGIMCTCMTVSILMFVGSGTISRGWSFLDGNWALELQWP